MTKHYPFIQKVVAIELGGNDVLWQSLSVILGWKTVKKWNSASIQNVDFSNHTASSYSGHCCIHNAIQFLWYFF